MFWFDNLLAFLLAESLYALHCYKSSVQENLYTYYKDELKNDSNKNCYQMKLFKLRSNGLLSASNGETI